MQVSELDTPALLIDLDRMEGNLRRVADYASEHGFRLRPHTKTHKNPAIGRMQLDLGAVGLTVAKVGEAEVMLETETPDLLVALLVLIPPAFGASAVCAFCRDRLRSVLSLPEAKHRPENPWQQNESHGKCRCLMKSLG